MCYFLPWALCCRLVWLLVLCWPPSSSSSLPPTSPLTDIPRPLAARQAAASALRDRELKLARELPPTAAVRWTKPRSPAPTAIRTMDVVRRLEAAERFLASQVATLDANAFQE